ncbi:hypothetical protein FRC0119_00136 [Corynebacterium diphtheriae]|nr:hypothetical protein FRC0119_00136 [Corynebacterium diphtheriae]CAB0875360.1 hypothetical protein FRC0408_00021 [Corynebacterium diphtheriae]
MSDFSVQLKGAVHNLTHGVDNLYRNTPSRLHDEPSLRWCGLQREYLFVGAIVGLRSLLAGKFVDLFVNQVGDRLVRNIIGSHCGDGVSVRLRDDHRGTFPGASTAHISVVEG